MVSCLLIAIGPKVEKKKEKKNNSGDKFKIKYTSKYTLSNLGGPQLQVKIKIANTVKCCYFFQDALKRNSARQIRFAFLLHAWNATLDYSENVLREAEQTDKLFNVRLNFCHYSLGTAQ